MVGAVGLDVVELSPASCIQPRTWSQCTECGVDQPTATVKSVATDKALRMVIVKITAQIQFSLFNATASARLAFWTALPFILVFMTRSSEHRRLRPTRYAALVVVKGIASVG